MTEQNLIKLRELLLNEFSEAELITLCRDIGIHYESLLGAGTFGKTREMVEAARAQDKLRALQSRLRELRPEAYAATGIGIPAVTEVGVTDSAGTTATRLTPSQRTGSSVPVPWIVLSLLVLLCLVVGAALVLPRLTGSATLVSTPSVQLTNASDASAAAAAATESATLNATITADTAVPTAALGAAPEATQTVAAEVVGSNSPTTVVTADIASSSTTADAEAITPTVVVETPAPADAAIAAIPVTPTTSIVSETHPAAQDIRGLNVQLPLFFSGKATTNDLQDFWTGEALRAVTGFGNVRLPRAMRIRPAQRNALNVTFEYVRPPTIVNESADSAIVTSREAWRYANSVNPTEICEVRDYVYNMVKEGDRYRVRTFQSRLLETGCN